MISNYDRWLTTQPDDEEGCEDCERPATVLILRPSHYCDSLYCDEHAQAHSDEGSAVPLEAGYVCPTCGHDYDEHPEAPYYDESGIEVGTTRVCPEPIPVCRYCNRAIWRHQYGDESIWRHFNGLMLCQPDENAPDFNPNEMATPT